MNMNQTLELIRDHGTDVTIGILVLGTLMGWTFCIVGAGVVAGSSVAKRLRSGAFMAIADPHARARPRPSSNSASTR